MIQTMPAPRNGYSLLEVLVALLVVNVAVLGFLRAQQSGEQRNLSLLARAFAVSALNDMEAHILMSAGSPDTAIGNSAYGSPPPAAPLCRHGACPGRAWARYSLARWKCRFERWSQHAACAPFMDDSVMPVVIPYGDGQVRWSGGDVEVSVRWREGDHEHALEQTVTQMD